MTALRTVGIDTYLFRIEAPQPIWAAGYGREWTYYLTLREARVGEQAVLRRLIAHYQRTISEYKRQCPGRTRAVLVLAETEAYLAVVIAATP